MRVWQESAGATIYRSELETKTREQDARAILGDNEPSESYAEQCLTGTDYYR
jgi:hypothetical protein